MYSSVDNTCIGFQTSNIVFNHQDRKVRYLSLIELLLKKDMSKGFPYIFKCQYQLKAFYRLINNKAVSGTTFIDGYRAGLIEYSKSINHLEPWILIQDSMYTDYNSRKTDLGYTQTLNSNGFLLHHGLVLDENFTPLGLMHQEHFFRERADFGKRKHTRFKSIEDKESIKWLNGIDSGVKFTEATKRPLIHIMDREADIVELVNKCIREGQQFIIRARHDRSTLDHKERFKVKDTASYRMYELLESNKDKKKVKRNLRDENGKEYEADCYLSQITLKLRGIDTCINCIMIQEIKSDKTTGTEWILLTNVLAEANHIITLYSKRWTIEDFHKCYKTGCNIEKRQFESRKTLTTVISFLALAAVVILRSRYFAINHPNENIDKIIRDKETIKIVYKLSDKYMKPIDFTICSKGSTLWWILLLGRMGGHQGFKQKGMPGWQTIWRGYTFFHEILEINNLLHNSS
jgi:hypothetical protein